MNENPMNPNAGSNGQPGFTGPQNGGEQFGGFTGPQNGGEQFGGFTAPQNGGEQFSGFTAPQNGGDQFGGFTAPQNGGEQFGGFTAPQNGGEQFSGFTAPQNGGEQFGGFTAPQNGGEQSGQTAAQGFYPENESGIREISGGFSNPGNASSVKNDASRKPGKKPKKKKEKHPVRSIVIAVVILLIIAAIALTPLVFMKLGDSKLASEDFSGAHSMYKLTFGLYGSKNRLTAAKAADDILQGGDIKSSIETALESGLKVHLHYDLNGGSFINANRQKDVLVEDKAQFADLYNATKPYYDFLGWKLAAVSYKPDFDDTVIDLSLKADFTPTVYEITYASLYSEEQNNPTEYTYETNSITLINPSRVGYTFVSWSGSEIDGDETTVVIMQGSSGDRAYIANWSPNKYSVTLNPGEYGNVVSPVTVTYDAAYEFPTLTKRGYTFKGWGDGANVYHIGSWTVANDVTLEPVFELDNYTLDFELDGGSMASVGKETYTVHDAAFDIPNPTRHGYTFLGWTYEGQSTAKKDVTIPTNSVGNLNFKANWTGNRHTIKLNLNGGKASASTVAVVYGSNYSIPKPTRPGYTFDGWYSGSEQYTSGTWELDNDLTVNAKWTANKYRVSFNSSGGGSVNAQTVTFGTYVSLPTVSKSGYDFDGWYDGSTKVTSGSWSIAKDVTLVAKWRTKTSNVTLNASGGSGVSNRVTIKYGDYYTLPTPTRAGYKFLGWYDNRGQRVYSSGTWTYSGDFTLTAKWESSGYVITLNANGGSVNTTYYNVDYGNYYSLPTPTKSGYDFDGWYDGSQYFSSSGYYYRYSNITLSARWSPKTYTIYLKANGGTVGQSSVLAAYGTTFTLPTPTRSGYSFAGWYDGSTRYNSGDTYKKTSDVTLTAKWEEASTYTITIDANGGTVSKTSIKVKPGDSYSIPLPYRAGYKFCGWADNNSREICPSNGKYNYGRDLYLIALWVPFN